MNPVLYDFRKPMRLTPEWHKLLLGWFQAASALADRSWAKKLPIGMEIAADWMEDGYARDVLAGLPAEAVGQRIMIGDNIVPTMLVLPRVLLLNLIAVMSGESSAQGDRELTVIEEELTDYFFANFWLPHFRESWPGPTQHAWHLQPREAQPRLTKLFKPDDVLLILHWQVHGPFGEARGQWYFPRQALIEALSKETKKAFTAADEKEWAARKVQIVRSLPVSLECILGTSQLRLSELSKLQVGDVLLLDGTISDGVTVSASGQQMFRGQAGRVGSWKAFRIDTIIQK